MIPLTTTSEFDGIAEITLTLLHETDKMDYTYEKVFIDADLCFVGCYDELFGRG